MTNAELQELLKQYPDDTPVAIMTDFQISQPVKHIILAECIKITESEISNTFEPTIVLDYFVRNKSKEKLRAFIYD